MKPGITVKSPAQFQTERAIRWEARRRGIPVVIGQQQVTTTQPSPEATQLPDGSWMQNEDLENIRKQSSVAYDILTNQGYEAYTQEIFQAEKALEPYKAEKGYDLARAIQKGVPEKTLKLLFSPETIEKSRAAQQAQAAQPTGTFLFPRPWDPSKRLGDYASAYPSLTGQTTKGFNIDIPEGRTALLKAIQDANQKTGEESLKLFLERNPRMRGMEQTLGTVGGLGGIVPAGAAAGITPEGWISILMSQRATSLGAVGQKIDWKTGKVTAIPGWEPSAGVPAEMAPSLQPPVFSAPGQTYTDPATGKTYTAPADLKSGETWSPPDWQPASGAWLTNEQREILKQDPSHPNVQALLDELSQDKYTKGLTPEEWMYRYGISPDTLAKAGKLMGGVTMQSTDDPRKVVTIAEVKVGNSPAPTTEEEQRWKMEAVRLGLKGKDNQDYVQQRWLVSRGLSPDDMAVAGKLMSGVTELKGKEIVPIFKSELAEKAYGQAVKEVKEWETKLKEESPELYKIFKEKGYEAYKQTYDAILKAIDAEKYHLLLTGVHMQAAGAPPARSKDFDIVAIVKDSMQGRLKVTLDQVKLVFGEKAVEDAKKIFLATTPTIGVAGAPPVVTKEEFAQLIAPKGTTEVQIKAIAPFVLTGERRSDIDWKGALKAGVDPKTVAAFIGTREVKALEWQAEYEKSSIDKKIGMSVDKAIQTVRENPKEALTMARDMGIYMIPVAGTAYMAKQMKEGGYTPGEIGWIVASAVTDVLIVIPIVGQVSAAIKGGLGATRAARALNVLRLGGEIVRVQVLAPLTMLRHPVQTAKAMLHPLEMLISPTRQTVAIFWRGSYSATMDMEKVIAGETREALATQKAMAEMTRLQNAGVKSGSVPIKIGEEIIGEVKFSGTGLQGILGKVTSTATPFGPEFEGKGVMVGKEGIFTSTEAPLGFAFQSATGKSPLYVYKGKELIGVMDDAGRVLDDSGREIAKIAQYSDILDFRGGKSFKWVDGKVLDAKTFEPIPGAVTKNGVIMTDDAKLIGKYYKGAKEYDEATKTLLTINKDGMLVDAAGKVIRQAKPKAIGIFPEGTKVESLKVADKIVGETKARPTFVLIHNKGVQELPEWAAKAENMQEMEQRAWQAFKSGKYSGDLYEPFKQYAIFIENENLLPPGTRIIPVLDDSGKPVMLWTRAPSGQKIQVPVMQLAEKDWFEKSLRLTQELGGKPTTFKPFNTAREALKHVENFPQESAEKYLAYMRAHRKDVGWYGGITEGLGTKDIDTFAKNPKKAAQEIYDVLKASAKPKRQIYLKSGKDSVVIGMVKDGIEIKVTEIHSPAWLKKPLGQGLKPFETSIVDGVRVQTPQSQLTRLFSRMIEEFGGKGYARWNRLARAMGGDIDLGIGAKAPTSKQLMEMKAQGIWNTVRDIFVPALTKETRLANTTKIAPDLEADTKAMLGLEERMAKAGREYRLALTASGRTALSTINAKKTFDRLETEYNERSFDLKDRMFVRALELDRISRQLPSRLSSRELEVRYRDLLERSAFREQGRLPSREEARAREEVRVSREERLLREGRTERVERVGRAERVERVERAERPSRVERAERTERVSRVERGGRERIPEQIPRPPRPPRPPIRPPSPPKPPPTKEVVVARERRRQEFASAIAWRQGIGWWAIKAPYRKSADAEFFRGKPPPNAQLIKGGVKSAYRSIQALTGYPPEKLAIDMGIMDILIGKPHRKPGELGAIRFKRDMGQQTISDITIGKRGKIVPRVTKGTVRETVPINPLGSSKMPAEIAKQIGSVSANVVNGRIKLKVRRL